VNLAKLQRTLDIFPLRMHKRLRMSFRWNLWHRHSILWPAFPYRERNFGDFMISGDLCVG